MAQALISMDEYEEYKRLKEDFLKNRTAFDTDILKSIENIIEKSILIGQSLERLSTPNLMKVTEPYRDFLKLYGMDAEYRFPDPYGIVKTSNIVVKIFKLNK